MTKRTGEHSRKPPPGPPDPGKFTEDPLAALGLDRNGKGKKNQTQVYSVSRINPLYNLLQTTDGTNFHYNTDDLNDTSKQINPSTISPQGIDENFDYVHDKSLEIDYVYDSKKSQQQQIAFEGNGEKASSGYGGSNEETHLEINYTNQLRLVEEDGGLIDQNPTFVKSIRVAGRGLKMPKPIPNPIHHSCNSVGGTLSTIPEGIVDMSVPQPIWPGNLDKKRLLTDSNYDTLMEDALFLYTSLSRLPENNSKLENYFDTSVRNLLMDLSATIDEALQLKTGKPEDLLKLINEKIQKKLHALKRSTEQDMKTLSVNMSNDMKINSVLRALSHSSSSGNSSSSGRVRTSSSNDEEIYHIPSGSSSSGFSDSPPGQRKISTPLLPHIYGKKSLVFSPFGLDDTSTLSRGIRNALIYGTIYRQKIPPTDSRLMNETDTVNSKNGQISDQNKISIVSDKDANASLNLSCATFNCDRTNLMVMSGSRIEPKNALLKIERDEKPSVWEMYYGVRAEGSKRYGEGNPRDIPIYPGGRPEADFTLDVPRSELLSKRMKEDKKWRFRCRLLTLFLGLVFFLLSVMAVSLILTRGKKMFGSMV